MSQSEIEQSLQCQICTENIIDTSKAILEPCKHSEICMVCAKKWCDEHNNCPFCRVQVTSVHHLHATEDEIKEATLYQTNILATNIRNEINPYPFHTAINVHPRVVQILFNTNTIKNKSERNYYYFLIFANNTKFIHYYAIHHLMY